MKRILSLPLAVTLLFADAGTIAAHSANRPAAPSSPAAPEVSDRLQQYEILKTASIQLRGLKNLSNLEAFTKISPEDAKRAALQVVHGTAFFALLTTAAISREDEDKKKIDGALVYVVKVRPSNVAKSVVVFCIDAGTGRVLFLFPSPVLNF